VVGRGQSVRAAVYARPGRAAGRWPRRLGLADDPYPVEAFHRGTCHRLRVGSYRILYYIDGDVITIERVDRVT
jgi:hypothetical protein